MHKHDDDKYMDEPYNHEAEYDSEIYPLMRQVFERCQALNLPLVCAVAYRNNPDKAEAEADGRGQFGIGIAVHMPGPHRTPLTFRVADAALTRSPDFAAALALKVACMISANAITDEERQPVQ